MKHYLELLISFIINILPLVVIYFIFIHSGFLNNINTYITKEMTECPVIQ